MTKGTHRFGYKLVCDICGEEKSFDCFDYTMGYKEDLGWIRKQHKEEWQDVCPECQEG